MSEAVDQPDGMLSEAGAALAARARELAQSAQEIEQLALFKEPPFEQALLLSPEEVAKQYTAENARQIQWRRHAAVQLLARDVGLADIAQILSMNHRTVAAIAAMEGRRVAAFTEAHAEALAADAMADLAVARTKRLSAGFKDLHIAAGIKLTHATALKVMSAGASDPNAGAVDVETLDPARQKFLDRVKQLQAEQTET